MHVLELVFNNNHLSYIASASNNNYSSMAGYQLTTSLANPLLTLTDLGAFHFTYIKYLYIIFLGVI